MESVLRIFRESASILDVHYMKSTLAISSAAIIAIFAILFPVHIRQLYRTASNIIHSTGLAQESTDYMTSTGTSGIRNIMSKLPHATVVPRRSSARGHADHGWLNTYHTFSFASYYDPRFERFGSLRVLNEDRVAPKTGFPTHPHRDAEIFSYILSGELTHRDSMVKKGAEGTQGKEFYRMKRGDVQFTTGGTGRHSLEITPS